jgi:BatD DUF11 like domain
MRMNHLFTKFIYCFLFSLLSFTTMAQPKFYTLASPTEANTNMYITLRMVIENGKTVQQFSPPNLSDFNIISGPNQEQSMNNINGVVSQSLSVIYILEPKKKGIYTIAGGSAVVDGQTLKSNSVKLNITGGASKSNQPNNNNSPFAGLRDLFDEPKPEKQFDDYILRNGETVPDKVSKNMQLRLQTDKTSCFVGEPILATYKLYTRLKSESSLEKNPSFNGFSVVDMLQQVDQSAYTHENLNGREYNVYIIRKAQLYPLQAGAAELELATLDNKIVFVKAEPGNSNYGNTFTENVSISSKPLVVNVKPLPEAGKPANFDGAVGNFEIESSVEKNKFSTDETGLLRINISGSGNMQLLTAPEIPWPKGFDAFETKDFDNTNMTTIPISGSKTFEIPFAVSEAGEYKIPAISFSFFNPATASYKTVSSKPITISVLKGSGKPISRIVAKTENKKSSSALGNFFANRWLVILAIAGLMFTGIFVWLKKDKKKIIKETVVQKLVIVETKLPEENISATLLSNKNYLEKTEACLQKYDCVDFYTLLNAELKYFITEKFSTQGEIINSKTLVNILDNAGVDNNLSLQTQVLFQDIEWQLYTPFERNEKLNETYAKAQTIIQVLSKHKV